MFSRKTIGEWFDIGKQHKHKYLLVYIVVNPSPIYVFPVFATSEIDYWQKYNDPFYSKYNGCDLVEVFDLSWDKEIQMKNYPNMILPRNQE
mgnify:CR=1 FL=1